MPLYALDAIDEAVGPTRSFVSRLGIADWSKLGAIALFVGGFGSVSFSANLPHEVVRSLPNDVPHAGDLVTVAGTAGLVVAFGFSLALFYLVRSLLEFVFYEALRDGSVSVRGALGRWWRHGIQLWVFRVVVAWSMLAGGSALASAISAGGITVAGLPDRTAVVATVAVTFGGYAVVAGFTTRFVVPVMLMREAGIAAAWGRFLRTLGANAGQYVSYLLVGLFVRFVADVLALSAAVLVAALLAVPVVVFLLPALVVASSAPELALSPPLVLLTGGLTAGYVLLVLVGAVLARLPFVVYVRYYALAVLRGTDPSLDLFA